MKTGTLALPNVVKVPLFCRHGCPNTKDISSLFKLIRNHSKLWTLPIIVGYVARRISENVESTHPIEDPYYLSQDMVRRMSFAYLKLCHEHNESDILGMLLAGFHDHQEPAKINLGIIAIGYDTDVICKLFKEPCYLSMTTGKSYENRHLVFEVSITKTPYRNNCCAKLLKCEDDVRNFLKLKEYNNDQYDVIMASKEKTDENVESNEDNSTPVENSLPASNHILETSDASSTENNDITINLKEQNQIQRALEIGAQAQKDLDKKGESTNVLKKTFH